MKAITSSGFDAAGRNYQVACSAAIDKLGQKKADET